MSLRDQESGEGGREEDTNLTHPTFSTLLLAHAAQSFPNTCSPTPPPATHVSWE